MCELCEYIKNGGSDIDDAKLHRTLNTVLAELDHINELYPDLATALGADVCVKGEEAEEVPQESQDLHYVLSAPQLRTFARAVSLLFAERAGDEETFEAGRRSGYFEAQLALAQASPDASQLH